MLFADKTVLITGASSGIGLELARVFARQRARLLLVARRAERLSELASDLMQFGGAADAEPLAADLAQPDAIDRLLSSGKSGEIDVLVNNAAIGQYGEFATQPLDGLEQMLRLNVESLVRLTRRVLPGMAARRRGWILNVASMAGFQPFPYMTVYAATKAFVIDFSLGLRVELRGSGVCVTCLCPGTTRTEFFDRGGYEARRGEFLALAADPARVAHSAVRALQRGLAIHVPGIGNKIAATFQRLLPASWLAAGIGRYMRPRPGSSNPS